MSAKKNLFISWSGNLSKNIAEALKLFFEETMQGITPFYSSSDIKKGSSWLNEINTSIDNSLGGIICLTKENHSKPWVLFEAGALSRVGIVCPIAFDMRKEDIKSPLDIFQSSAFNKKEFKQLFEDLNTQMKTGLSQKVIDRFFEPESNYDRLEKKITAIIENHNYPSNIDPDQTLALLLNLDEKINQIIKVKSRDSTSDLKFLSIQLENIDLVLDSLESSTLTNLKEEFKRILMGVDYFISTFVQPNKEIENKLEKLNTKINAL